MRPGIEERFWIKVNKDGPVPSHRPDLGQCYVWTSVLGINGHGRFRVGGRKGHFEYAHRVAFFLRTGHWPKDKLLHHCDNPGCVREETHCFEGSIADNNADCRAKGRHGHGVTGVPKLARNSIHEIRLAASAGASARMQAALYDVHEETIRRAVSRNAWSFL